MRGHRARRHALFREEVEHRACALLRKALIEIVAADAVRVAFDLEYEAGMR